MRRLSADQYIDGVLAGDRVVLSQAITLIESQLATDQIIAQTVLDAVLARADRAPEASIFETSVRVGITGVPGVGKSTFIESFGNYLTGLGHRLAVLAVDPTSQRTGGSILGDKTRMETLSLNPNAYIRPTPASDALGGVGHRTRETILLCEAAGFDVILVETVGVGQSETLVHGMTDFFLLLLLAGAGDELQGLKRGIMELADALAITKADSDNQPAANLARLEYENALHLFPPTGTGWQPPVLTCSALTGAGIADIWQQIVDHQTITTQNGHRAQRREAQQVAWFRALLRQAFEARFYAEPDIRARLAEAEMRVAQGDWLPRRAVLALLGA
jgi:LAO/AO transport system kinase